jgi:hypothetical protein
MNSPDLIGLSILVYATTWVALVVGVAFIRRGNKRAQRIRTWLLNKRIEQFRHPPFKNLLKLWMTRKYLLTSVSFMFLIITPAVLLFFLVGMFLLTPLLAVYQGLVVGFLIARYDRRHLVCGLGVGAFEFGYWAVSGALGMSLTAGIVFNGASFVQSLAFVMEELASGYWLLIVLCVVINAFGEVAGPMYWNMTGPLPLETLSKGDPIDEDA